MTFGLAQTVSDDFLSYPMDGIMALGRPETITASSTGVNSPSLMDVLVSQKVISSKFFGLALWRDADGGNNNGEINFGAPDTSRYDGDLNYVSAIRNANGFWEIPVADAGVDGKSAGLTGRSAIIDSGTSFILMPQGDATKLHALIPGSSQSGETFTVPCDATNKVQLTFGGTTYDINTKDYIGNALGGGACSSNIVGRQVFGATQWLVGDVFLKNVYAGFDYDGQRLGFGVKNGAAGASSTPTTSTPASTTQSRLDPSPSTISSPSTTLIPTSAPITSTNSVESTPSSPSTAAPLNPSSTHTLASTASPSITSTTTTSNTPQTEPSTHFSIPSLTSLLTTEPGHPPTATGSNGSPFPTSRTPGFLPSGTSFTTSTSIPPQASVSTTGSATVQKGEAGSMKQPAALIAFFLALCCTAFFGV
jgi:hypothetical protein